jgi:SAM-dependent methyltransferase
MPSPESTANVDDVRQFWEDRAREFGSDCRATLADTALRMLEIRTMRRELKKRAPRIVLDVGCGNGFSTRWLASRFPSVQFTGVDYSTGMIDQCKCNTLPNAHFAVADVLDQTTLPSGPFDVIYTQRCIQNVTGWEQQVLAIDNLRGRLQADGVLLLMECSRDGVQQLNGFRGRFGLPAIDNIEPWHNTFLHDQLMQQTFNAEIVYFSSTYMFLTKVVHPRLTSIAGRLPHVGRFGYDRLYVVRQDRVVSQACGRSQQGFK